MKDFLHKINRLILIFLLILSSSLWAQGDKDSISSSSDSFVITSDSSWCHTETECSFTLILPEISPNQVSIGNPRLPEGVEFLASYKDLWVEGSNSGTSIRLLFTFSRSGSIIISPLDIMVDGTLYQVPFAPVEVFQNPRSLKPEVKLLFQDEQGRNLSLGEDGSISATVGSPLLIMVSVRYGAALHKFHWDLVPNGLFQQVANFQENFGATELSHQFQPVAQFSLIPLELGALRLPAMELEVEGYDQKSHRLVTGNVPIVSKVGTVARPASSLETDVSLHAQQALASAFTALPEEPSEDVIKYIHLQDEYIQNAKKLAQLRWKEQRGFPWQKIFQERVELEKNLGIESGKREKSWLLGWLFLGLGFIMLGVTIFGIIKQRIFLSVVLGFCGILILVWGIIYSLPLFKPAGILASQTLSKIPETDAANLFTVEPFSRLEIKKEVLGWYYVSADGLEGWAPVENVIPIAPPQITE